MWPDDARPTCIIGRSPRNQVPTPDGSRNSLHLPGIAPCEDSTRVKPAGSQTPGCGLGADGAASWQPLLGAQVRADDVLLVIAGGFRRGGTHSSAPAPSTSAPDVSSAARRMSRGTVSAVLDVRHPCSCRAARFYDARAAAPPFRVRQGSYILLVIVQDLRAVKRPS